MPLRSFDLLPYGFPKIRPQSHLNSDLRPSRLFPLLFILSIMNQFIRIAFHNLFRGGQRVLVFAMIAFFAGVISMSLGLLVAQSSQLKISGQAADFQTYNINILGAASEESAIRQAVQAQKPEKLGIGHRTALADLRMVGINEPVSDTDSVLVGRSDPGDYVVSGADWNSQPNGMYVYERSNLKAGSQVEVTFPEGTTAILPTVTQSLYRHPETGVLPVEGTPSQPSVGPLVNSLSD